jgi:hypothetical protein
MNYISNVRVLKEFNDRGQTLLKRSDRYLVERNEEGGWDITRPADRFVSADQFGANFGLWKDKEVTEGHLWWKKVIRPLDGKVDQDEVLPMGEVLRQHHDTFVEHPYPNRSIATYDQLRSHKTELALTPDGGNIHTEWNVQRRHNIRNDLGRVSNGYLVD